MFVKKPTQTEKPTPLDAHRKNRFYWSLKPLIIVMKFVGGINLLHSSKTSNSNNTTNLLFITWAAFVIVSNIVVNGSCIEISKYFWRLEHGYNDSDSPWVTFFWHPQMLLQFTRFYSALSFFLFVPAIHAIFFFTVLLSRRWKDLLYTFQVIHCHMRPTERFYRKCRRLCIFFIFLLVLVNGTWLESALLFF